MNKSQHSIKQHSSDWCGWSLSHTVWTQKEGTADEVALSFSDLAHRELSLVFVAVSLRFLNGGSVDFNPFLAWQQSKQVNNWWKLGSLVGTRRDKALVKRSWLLHEFLLNPFYLTRFNHVLHEKQWLRCGWKRASMKLIDPATKGYTQCPGSFRAQSVKIPGDSKSNRLHADIF